MVGPWPHWPHHQRGPWWILSFWPWILSTEEKHTIFFRFLKALWKKTHENYRKKFSLINQFLYVFQCSFYVYVCFVYPLLCLQSIFFANISLVFTITARSWYLVQHQRMDRDFTRKKIFLEIFFSVKSIAMTKKRLEFSALFVLPRAFLKKHESDSVQKTCEQNFSFLYVLCVLFFSSREIKIQFLWQKHIIKPKQYYKVSKTDLSKFFSQLRIIHSLCGYYFNASFMYVMFCNYGWDTMLQFCL